MAENNEVTKKTNKNTKTTEKNVATGSTKKVVQKRSSSVAIKNSKNAQETTRVKSIENKKYTSKTAKKQKEVDNTKKNDKINNSTKPNSPKETTEIEEVVAKEMKNRKKISNVEFGKINGRVFQNVCMAVAIMLYLDFVILGFINIKHEIFMVDLKVFSVALLVISIGFFEYGYKKDSGRHAIHGIEVLVLAFITMALIYVNLMWSDNLIYVVAFVTYIIAIYYVIKSIIIYQKMKKEYFVNEMKEIIKK